MERLDEIARAMSMLQKRLLRDVGRAIADFRLVEPGDRILVGVSGGKTLSRCCTCSSSCSGARRSSSR